MKKFKNWLKTWKKCKFLDIWSFSFQLSKNKFFEFQIGKFDENCNSVVDIGIRVTRKMSHAGTEIVFLILRWHIEVRIYDIRHWDETINDWENEKISLKTFIVGNNEIGPITKEVNKSVSNVSNQICNIMDEIYNKKEELKNELPPFKISQMEDKLSDLWIHSLHLKRKYFFDLE